METTTKLRWSRPGSFLLVAAAFLASAAASGVNVGQFDDHLQKRKELAEASAREAYRPDPYNVTNSFNAAVHRAVSSSRREMRERPRKHKKRGPCRATNPIDKCWRCRRDWATDRQRLARCARGFGHATTGGLGGKIYVVTDPTDLDISMSNCEDGLIDVVQSSTGITISNCHFTNHNDVMLFGASDSWPQDQIMQITVAFNHFGRGLVQRMPRCRWGFFHVVNNDYTHWLMYAIGGGDAPTIISQGNRYIAPPNIAAKVITKHYAEEGVWKNWVWHTEDDLFMNGAIFNPSGGAPKQVDTNEWVKPKPGTYVTRLTRFSGTLSCCTGKPC
ncbi:male gametophyte-specific2 [Zea mays]|uniref:Male gametophyte-specific2 n=1 Tax=Zea mays TaxID=4577 RepID=A0A1D6QQJ6_MAIZE|nr:male gametophyte-specific2 [Zea mays]